MINAEDFLNDDDSALGRPRRIDAIGTELVAVAGSQFDVCSHGWTPFGFEENSAGMQSVGIFQFFSFKIFRAEVSSSSESVGSLFFTARDSIIAPTKPLNKAIACCLASCSSPPICAAIISR